MKNLKKYFVLNLIFITIFLFKGHSEVYKSGVTASYYAEQFHGKKTSNGEKFNMYDFTCAHKTLPFDTVLKVTNLANGKSVNVRVNDRGPFVQNREIDLSKAAAVKLDMIKTGTAKVKLEIVKLGADTKASRQTAAKASVIMKKTAPKTASAYSETKKSTDIKKNSDSGLWDIQVGAFSSRSNANVLAQKLLKEGFKDVVFQTSGDVVRVVLRKVTSENLPSVEKKLKENGHSEYTVKKRVK